MESLKRRILEIAYEHNLSHLGSYFSSLEIIDKIFKNKKPNEVFVLSAGHCAVALYAVIEKYHGIDAEDLFLKHGGHPHRDEENFLFCSTGSLGLGLPIAVGRAMADKYKKVYCLISDGECAEGSIWESLRFIKEQNIENIEVHVNINGYCAYDAIDTKYLIERLESFLPNIIIHKTTVNQFSFLSGLNAHYHVMSKENYCSALEEL